MHARALDPGIAVLEQLPREIVELASLSTGDSPRLAGQDGEHVRRLAQMEQELPPILVHRSSMRIIDGMHRYRAAEMRGAKEIEACFFDGTEEAAFLLAVQLNIAHGLPLTLAERSAAAGRILLSYPYWSDRAIARTVGLGHATVGSIRQRTGVGQGTLVARLGRDGRTRALNMAAARRLVSELISTEPDASIRAIARKAGVSPATARDVRDRLMRGDDPVPAKQRGDAQGRRQVRRSRSRDAAGRSHARRPVDVWRLLHRDPSLRSSETGRTLLKWLAAHSADADAWQELLDSVPPHSVVLVIEMARGLAENWEAFADNLEQRANQS